MLIGSCAVSNLKNTPTVKEVNGLAIERRKLSELVKAEWNPRKITTEQQAALQRSLAEFGTVEPIIINRATGNVVGGHQRLDALLALGETETDVLVGDWSAEKEKALNVALNKIHGDWDEVKLADVLTELQSAELEIALTGFSEEEIERLLFKEFEGETDADDVPDESQVETRCKRGDLWQLGEHRLLCGDSTVPENVERLIGGIKADMIFTDPPYGVSIGAKNRMLNSFQKAGRNLTDIVDDNSSPDELKSILLPAFKNARALMSDDCTVFVTAPQGGDLGMMMMMMQEAGLKIRHVLIWKKNAPTFSMNRLDYDYQHEPILLTWGKRHKFYGLGDHKTSVWEIDKPRKSAEHPTMKPVALVKNALLNNSTGKDNVYDPFLGSGTTLIACEQLGRRCFGLEIEPRYCDVILARWEKFTGKVATLLENDTTAHQQDRA